MSINTLLVSDLHLGGRLQNDVLRAPAPRELLKERLAEVDRLVLLGDVLEFRHSPQRDALREGLPILRELGDALKPGTPVVIVPGNHDWQFLERFHAVRTASQAPKPLALDERISSADASVAAEAVANAMGRPLEVAYPGLWIDDHTFATHGHYLDVHALLPTVERLGAGALQRLARTQVPLAAQPDDYERVLAPWYAFISASVERLSAKQSTDRATTGARAYKALQGRGASARAFGVGLRASVAALNLSGIGPLSAEISGQAMLASALHAIDEVDARLQIGADHLIFGHCHRPGPLPTDDVHLWASRVGTKLHNTGNWVYEPRFQASAGPDGAYWPGTVINVAEGRAPRLERLLDGLDQEQLVAGRSAPTPSGS